MISRSPDIMRLALYCSQDLGEIKMKPLRTFFMEDWLETFRFKSQYNLGESGGRPRTVKQLLNYSGFAENEAYSEIMDMSLQDSPNRGRNDLRQIIANMHPGASVENVLITTGTSEALFLLFRYLKPKKVALPLPAFQLLYEIPKAMDASIVCLPIRYHSDGQPFADLEEWLQILEAEQPDCILINNPHNPTGLIFPDQFLAKIVAYVNSKNCYLIGDEHYRFLSTSSETEFLGRTIYQNNSKIFITGSFIKCFGTPGLRIGWCIGPLEALNSMQNEKNYTTHTVNPFSEWLAYKVLSNPQSELFYTAQKEWLENKKILTQFLASSKTLYGTEPQGGLVTILGFKNVNTVEDLTLKIDQLLNKGIFILPLSSMEMGIFSFQKEKFYKTDELALINRGFGFRLGLGIQPSKFQEALSKMEQILLNT